MKHAGYGRYDVEVNGEVVGRAVERPEGWEATGHMKGIDVSVHGHGSLESAVMAVGRALVPAVIAVEQIQVDLLEVKLARYGMSAGHAHQCRAEAKACRKALGFSVESETVSPRDLRLAIEQFKTDCAEHDAALLERVAEKLCDQHEFNGSSADICFSDDLFDEAARIRQQAK